MGTDSSLISSISTLVDKVHSIAQVKRWLKTGPQPTSTPVTPTSTQSAPPAVDMGSPYYLGTLPIGMDKKTFKKQLPVVLGASDQNHSERSFDERVLLHTNSASVQCVVTTRSRDMEELLKRAFDFRAPQLSYHTRTNTMTDHSAAKSARDENDDPQERRLRSEACRVCTFTCGGGAETDLDHSSMSDFDNLITILAGPEEERFMLHQDTV